MSKNEEKWLASYEALKAYIEEHHHLPPKDAPLGAKYLLNWMKYQRKRMKAGLMSEEQKALLDSLLDSRSTEHTGGRRKKEKIIGAVNTVGCCCS